VAVAGAAFIMAGPATAGPSSVVPGALSVTASPGPADVLPGESTRMFVAVTNVGGASLTGVTVTESLPAALTYVTGSVVAVRTSGSGSESVYSQAGGGAGKLGVSSPGLLVSAFDGIDLAAGQTLRVSFLVTVNPALAPGVDTLRATSVATSGTSVVASDTVSLNVLKQALAVAYGDGSN
jgi:uncharacterized repeat protein (TIGR01451 family)